MNGAAEIVVDVVINNHNYGAYLADAIASVRAQTHPEVNLVVVDDGSEDDSREILAGEDDGIEVVLQPNRGQAAAINAGLEHCAGEAVIFLDADDTLHPEATANVAAALAATPRAAKVQYRMDVIDAEGRPTGEIKPHPHLPLPSGDLVRAELAQPYDLVWMATSGNAFRLAPLRRILPIPVDSYPRTGADWYLVHLTTLLGPVVSLDRVGASYRVHGANSYQPQDARLDLDQIRQRIEFAAVTSTHLLELAAALEIPHPAEILSVADLANRLISLKLDPASHPLADDSVSGLLRDAGGALRRREGASAAIKASFAAWFSAMAVAPPKPARQLAEIFLFPERRQSLNGLLGRLQRPGRNDVSALPN